MNCRSRSHDSRRNIYRDLDHRWIAGVCSGIADYWGVSRGFVRVAFLILAIPFTFTITLLYIVLAVAFRHKPRALYSTPREEQFWRDVRTEPSRTTADLAKKFELLERRLRHAEARVTSRSFRLRRAFDDLARDGRVDGSA